MVTIMSYFQGTTLSASTIKVYEPCIQKWRELVPDKSLEYIIYNPRQAIRTLALHLKKREKIEKKSVCTMNNLRNYIAPILAVLRHSPHIAPTVPDRQEFAKLWLEILNEVSKPMKDRQKQHLPTVNQSKKGGSRLTYDQIIQRRDQGDLGMYEHLLLSMYTYIYPVRADYYATELVKDGNEPTTANYIRIEKDHSELVIRDFKTAKVYPPIHYPQLPDILHQVILRSLEKEPRLYLFEKPNGKPYSRNSFSQWASRTLHQIFGVEMTLTLIRHHFISTLSMDVPVIELEEIGQLMGHSIPTQRMYKWYPQKKEDGEVEEDEEDGEDEEDEEDEEEKDEEE